MTNAQMFVIVANIYLAAFLACKQPSILLSLMLLANTALALFFMVVQ